MRRPAIVGSGGIGTRASYTHSARVAQRRPARPTQVLPADETLIRAPSRRLYTAVVYVVDADVVDVVASVVDVVDDVAPGVVNVWGDVQGE